MAGLSPGEAVLTNRHAPSDQRRPALVAFAVLAVALVAVVLVTTPWQTLSAPSGGSVAPDPARDFAAADLAREDRYHRLLWPAVLGGTALSLIAALALGFSAVGARLVRAVARPFGGGAVARLVLGTLAVTALTTLAALPAAIWREQVQRDYGLIVRGWSDFAVDLLTAYAVLAGGTLIGLSVLYLLLRRFPRCWWAPGAVLGAGLVIASSFVYPLVVEPAFNDFSPLPPGALRSSLLDLAARDGVRVQDVLVADESKRSTKLNAYVSGIGSSRRIVLYDTTVATLPPAEIDQIVAHEFGHVKRDDVLRGTLVGALGASCGVCALFVALSSRRLRRRAGVTDPANPDSLALVLAVVAALVAVSTPPALLVSRRVEARADVHALDLTGDPAALIAMQRRLALRNLSDLDANRWVVGLQSTHPDSPLRIAHARTWARLHGRPEPADQAAVPIPPRTPAPRTP